MRSPPNWNEEVIQSMVFLPVWPCAEIHIDRHVEFQSAFAS